MHTYSAEIILPHLRNSKRGDVSHGALLLQELVRGSGAGLVRGDRLGQQSYGLLVDYNNMSYQCTVHI